MDWEFDQALNGNVALTGELELAEDSEFTLGLAFGDSHHSAITTLLQSLATPFADHRRRHAVQWNRTHRTMLPLDEVAGDRGDLYHMSYKLLLAHEDKTYQGAMIASMSIPWGEVKGEEDIGGYHLVWTRDMVNSATGLLAANNVETPLRALVYLAASQQEDGGFAQNFWLDGTPHWTGIQLDEVAFPILLAWRLHRMGALQDFDPYPMVLRAASFLVRNGPATQQERWEEVGGYSPSTLASNIAALVCAASFARERGDRATAEFIGQYADFLECHIEPWTVTTVGTLLPDVGRHFIRIHPIEPGDVNPIEDPNVGVLGIANRPPGSEWRYPAKEIVDAGFLELVRYGVRQGGDALIEDSLRVVDSLLKVETPLGPCWRRYNNDGYGQREDGGPYVGYGKGRAWPLLTGERGHYELAAGRDARPYARALEGLAQPTALLAEQVWDEADRPQQHLLLGRPTGSAMPLMWAHAEYVKLLRSLRDGAVFDLIPEVAERYAAARRSGGPIEVWKPNRQPLSVQRGWTFRVQAPDAFMLHWSLDDWHTVHDTNSVMTKLGIAYVDIPIRLTQRAPLKFTFRWGTSGEWGRKDYLVRPV